MHIATPDRATDAFLKQIMLGARVKALEINVDVTTSGARENKGEREMVR